MNRNRKPIRLTESQLHRVIMESVKSVIREMNYEYRPDRTYWWEDATDSIDHDIDCIGKERQMERDWDKIDKIYDGVHHMNYAHDYENDRLFSDTYGKNMSDGKLGILAQCDEYPECQKIAQSFKGNTVKDTPFKDSAFNDAVESQRWLLNYPYAPRRVPDTL